MMPGFNIGYGYNSKLELDLGFGLASVRGTGGLRLAGFGETTAGLK